MLSIHCQSTEKYSALLLKNAELLTTLSIHKNKKKIFFKFCDLWEKRFNVKSNCEKINDYIHERGDF